MEEKKFELGPLQKAWIQSLRDHPERQHKEELGRKMPIGYKACCLGEAAMILGIAEWHEGVGLNSTWMCLPKHGDATGSLGGDAYLLIGLRSDIGISEDGTQNLVAMNDETHTWPQIADELEAHPEKWFTESK